MEARLRVDHVRGLLRLLGETSELERAGECPKLPLVAGLAKLVDADVAGFFAAEGFGSSSGIRLEETIDVGWATPGDRERTFQYILQHGDPIAEALAVDPPRSPCVIERRSVIPDSAWYRSELVGDVHRSMRLDEVIIGVLDFAPHGTVRAFYLKRRWGARPYTGEELALVQLFLDEARAFDAERPSAEIARVAPAQRSAEVARVAPARRSAFDSLGLAPREARTLGLLLEGLSEKEAAAQLGITANTLHGYAKDLYRKLGVSSRYELFSRFHRRPSRTEGDDAG